MSIRFVLCLLVLALPMAHATERMIEKTFDAPDGVTLKVDTYRGSVEVRKSPDDKIHLQLIIDPGTDEPKVIDQLMSRLQLDFKPSGSTVLIQARNPSETGMRFVWEEKLNLDLAYHLLVPERCNLNIRTNDGGVTVDSLIGKMDVTARKGTIFFRQIDGDIHAITEGGDVVISRCSGSVDVKDLLGNVRIGTVFGHTSVKTTNGDIDFQHVFGGLTALAEAGDITVGLPKELTKDIKVDTNSGAITVRLDPDLHCTIKASSVWGHVHTSLPLVFDSGGDDRKSMNGRLNGGGPLLSLHADGGQVQVDPLRI